MRETHKHIARLLTSLAACFACNASALAADHVTLRRDGKEIHVDGLRLLTAQDGGLLLLARDGVLWTVPPEQLVRHTEDDKPLEHLSRQELSSRLLAELPDGFDVHNTKHYVILYGTSPDYARWCGSLFERLYRAFTNYWTHKQFDLVEPEYPLVAIVFADRAAYARFSKPELGEAAGSIIGYYSLRTNRMTMYDLTGIEALGQPRSRGGSAAKINRILAQPDAQRTVATIVHEATHQIAFNCGLHARYSDCPLWLSEGIALYFETPDLSNSKGWRGIGKVNGPRLDQFRRYLTGRPADSLQTLIADDKRFRDPKQGLDAYAETWALTYYLLQRRSKQYIAYLKVLSKKKPLRRDDPQTRLGEFQQAFGDLGQLDAEFLRYMVTGR